MACFRQHRSFTSLSRRKRRQKVFALKHLIYRERHRCGGVFYDECDIDYYRDNPDSVWSWSDICFTGRDPAVLWNAEIITARLAINDLVRNRAFDHARQQLSEAERLMEFRYETTPNYNAKGKIVSYTLVTQDKPRYAIFNGLTFNEYTQQLETEIVRDDPPAVYCGYEILPGYAYGIGLRMIVEADALSVEVIEAAIADFRSRGEVEWRSPQPVKSQE